MAELPNTLLGLRRALAQGSLSVPEALQAQRQRVRELDAVYGCAVSIPDEPQPDPTHQAPLAGVGLAHKDIFDTDGHRPGLGHDLGGPAPERCHAHALQRLRGAGASHLARLAMAEHACGATGANPRWRPCVNPRHVGAVVGGLLLIRFVASPSALALFLAIGGALFGYFLPNGLLDSKVAARQLSVRREIARATSWGHAYRLARRLSGNNARALGALPLRRDAEGGLVLGLPKRFAALADSAVRKRFAELALSLGSAGRTENLP